MRMPRTMGLPPKISGLTVMRFSSASSITSILPSPYQTLHHCRCKRPKRHPLTLEPFGERSTQNWRDGFALVLITHDSALGTENSSLITLYSSLVLLFCLLPHDLPFRIHEQAVSC